MKRMQLIAAALCLIMLTTIGAGVVAAKQTENPRQAGASHIYFYDVKATDTHGTGKLQINVDKHTFVFNGKGFVSSAMIELKARAAGDSNYKVFATGKVTPAGNLHLTGTWEKGAALPAAVFADYGIITGLKLDNEGGFVAKVACYYSTDGGVTWKESAHGDGAVIHHSDYVWDLAIFGVPEHALVKMHAVVVAGNDKTGSEVFQYYPPIQNYDRYTNHYSYWAPFAEYKITGTTLNDKLYFLDVYAND